MSHDKKNNNPEEFISNLARVLYGEDYEPDAIDDKPDEKYLENAMDIVNDWRREMMFEKARAETLEFDKFVEELKRVIPLLKEKGISVLESSRLKEINLKARPAFYRKLDKISPKDLESSKIDSIFLKLWQDHKNIKDK